MFDTLAEIEKNYLLLQEQMCDPVVATDQQKIREMNKVLLSLEEPVQLYQQYKKIAHEEKEAEEILAGETDPEMIALAKEQLISAQNQLPEIEEKLKVALLPKDPNDNKNIFLEIRPAAGGDEAGLFAAELLKAYMLYAQIQ